MNSTTTTRIITFTLLYFSPLTSWIFLAELKGELLTILGGDLRYTYRNLLTETGLIGRRHRDSIRRRRLLSISAITVTDLLHDQATAALLLADLRRQIFTELGANRLTDKLRFASTDLILTFKLLTAALSRYRSALTIWALCATLRIQLKAGQPSRRNAGQDLWAGGHHTGLLRYGGRHRTTAIYITL